MLSKFKMQMLFSPLILASGIQLGWVNFSHLTGVKSQFSTFIQKIIWEDYWMLFSTTLSLALEHILPQYAQVKKYSCEVNCDVFNFMYKD